MGEAPVRACFGETEGSYYLRHLKLIPLECGDAKAPGWTERGETKPPPHWAAATACAPAFGAAQVGFAQDQGGQEGPGRHACMREAMAKLNLTEDQKAKLQELRESGQKGPDRRAAMEKILSPEQLSELRDAHQACGGEHHD